MKAIHMKDLAHKMHMPHVRSIHMPSCHAMMLKTEHIMRDPRFWAVLAMVAITVLVITLAIMTRPQGGSMPEPINPVMPEPFLY